MDPNLYKLYSLNNELLKDNSVWPSGLFTGIIESENGSRFWLLNGLKSRIDGPAVIYSYGTEMYFVDDKRHRIGGPAYINPDGTQMYFEDNKCHRMGGPAVIRPGGAKEYFIYGKRITELEHNLLCDIMKLKGLI
jgi:hypothetical protein